MKTEDVLEIFELGIKKINDKELDNIFEAIDKMHSIIILEQQRRQT